MHKHVRFSTLQKILFDKYLKLGKKRKNRNLRVIQNLLDYKKLRIYIKRDKVAKGFDSEKLLDDLDKTI